MNSPTATITLKALCEDLSVSEKTLRRMIRNARIPEPMKLNGNAYRWLQSEILLWQQLGMPDRHTFRQLKSESVSTTLQSS